jgi:hypothetical protein
VWEVETFCGHLTSTISMLRTPSHSAQQALSRARAEVSRIDIDSAERERAKAVLARVEEEVIAQAYNGAEAAKKLWVEQASGTIRLAKERIDEALVRAEAEARRTDTDRWKRDGAAADLERIQHASIKLLKCMESLNT